MTTRTRNPPIAVAKERILGLFAQTSRPVLIGHASLELRWPLSWVEALFEELRHEGKIRELTKSESVRYDVTHGFFRCVQSAPVYPQGMRRLRILIDVDEVLADFQGPTFESIHYYTGKRFAPSDFEIWDIFEALPTMAEVSHISDLKDLVFADIDAKGWCLNLKPFAPAQEAVARLREFADVYALTSPHHSESWYWERVEWLKKHFGMDKKHVIQTASKFLVRGDVFIDDNPLHIEAWRTEHPDKMALLWHIENTRKLGFDDIRVRTWEDVLARIQALR